VISACISRTETGSINTTKEQNQQIVKYAQGFALNLSGKTTVLTVKNPWQNATGIVYRYILSDTIKTSHFIDDFTWAVKTPVKNVICLSTTHVGLISFFGLTKSITGVSGKNYIVNELVRREIENGNIFDVGYDEGLNYELIVKLKPDVVFAYGVSVSITNTVRKLNELGIPVVLIGEYLEPDPLGKMEWVKAVSACYGMYDMVSQKFDSVADRYTELAGMAGKTGNNPEVLLGLPWRGNWYVSGARSYIARLITNAGGNYIWRDLDFNESRPLGLEMIYEKALTADFWINPGEARTKNEIISVDPRFANLPCMISDRVYNNDNRMSPTGGNDFFETGVVEPDIILSDLIAILQPHLLPSYKLKYYRKVN
ncbi:MAG TPA: ABC transporter substrate-binding protein, partial [Bacteroidales bacterium]|nr:ABC transporter substrate-binding protein [Bacteroidales bacterium]